ncbi:MAG: hypothetical protein OXF08_07435 [Bacteroidetes bacterium]|nr:hypothetical protein [Bacteroidota bacterium]
MPNTYRKVPADPEENGHIQAMMGLLRSGLLKRFESSCYAFRKTINKMIVQQKQFLKGIDNHILTTAFLNDISGDDKSLFDELLKEDPSLFEHGGTVAATQTGEEYRHTLRKALSEYPNQFTSLPWKIGSGMIKGKQRGIFFCAVVGDNSDFERTYLRFVNASPEWEPHSDPQKIIDEIGTCLRLIECDEETPTSCPNKVHENVYDFWEIAQEHILEDWTKQTDPASFQPKLDRINREVAEFIRSHTPGNISSANCKKALDIVETPWPRREQIDLRKIFKSKEDISRPVKLQELSSKLVNYILETGLEAIEPPDPLPPIETGDIKLLCWMAIDCEDTPHSIAHLQQENHT